MAELVAGVAELLPGSADTWREDPPEARVPAALLPIRSGGPGVRLAAWRRRHRLRAERAEAHFAASRRPERGLPVAEAPAVRAFIRELLGARRGRVAALLGLHALAALAGLAAPRILGHLVDVAARPGTAASALTALAWAVGGVVVVQALLTFGALVTSAVLGQDVLASARESVVRTVLQLPLGRVEQASSGDLVTRVTRDVGTMSESVRFGLPEAVIASVTTALTVAAMLVNSVLLTVPLLLTLPLLWLGAARYLHRAPQGYITEGATYSVINTTLTETVEGARTVEALGLQSRRIGVGDADIEVSAQAERYTMSLRNLLFALIGVAHDAPLVLVVLLGAYGYVAGWVSLGQITAATLYVQALVEPLDRLIRNLDRLQVGIASTTRLLGIGAVPPDRQAGDALPVDGRLVGRDLRFAYREGHDVLHGIDLAPRPGERLAIVGPSGSGKSTLGRLLAGINRPRTGSAAVGGVELTELPLEALRREVALVTQEHHIFVGTIADNVGLAREGAAEAEIIEALRAVDGWDWVSRLPDRLQTRIGSGQRALTPAQAQQVALARLVLADPHTLVLDEATSLIDPRTARHLETSMAALLTGRSVVAIAHRLHTAHDADRIAVLIDGRVVELGSHTELVAAGGQYAALWRAWTS